MFQVEVQMRVSALPIPTLHSLSKLASLMVSQQVGKVSYPEVTAISLMDNLSFQDPSRTQKSTIQKQSSTFPFPSLFYQRLLRLPLSLPLRNNREVRLQTAKVSLPKAVHPACEHLRAGTASPSVLSTVPHLSQEITKSFLRRLSLVRKIVASRKSAKLGIKTQKYCQPFHKLLTTSGLSSTQ